MEGASESSEEKGLCWFGKFEMTTTFATNYHQEEYWKNSAWLGTGIMIDRETPLAEIVGQMSLSRSTDVSTQSWVFISVKNMILQNWQGGYIYKNGGN